MNHVPLFPEQYGSNIVQLSVYKTSLLVSTLERTFVLDTETNKLSQVSVVMGESAAVGMVDMGVAMGGYRCSHGRIWVWLLGGYGCGCGRIWVWQWGDLGGVMGRWRRESFL